MSIALFEPLLLRGLNLRNRIIVSPMLTYAARAGFASDIHIAHLAKFAAGGAGGVFVESTKIDPRGCTTSSDLGLWKDEFVPVLQRACALIRSYGAAAGIQLGHSGRKARVSVPWEGGRQQPGGPTVEGDADWELVAPSAVPHGPGYRVPRALSREEIGKLLAAWEEAAARADRAGFDILEIHGGHGYLVHQFLSPSANIRTDEYGGSFVNRARFAVEVVKRVRRVWPERKPLFFRMSTVDEEGWRVADSIRLARLLGEAGVDVVDCSAGGMAPTVRSQMPPVAPGYQVPFAEALRHNAGIRTMAVGMIKEPMQANQIVAEGQADLVALAREFLRQPTWPVIAAETLGHGDPYSLMPRSSGYWLEMRAKGRKRT